MKPRNLISGMGETMSRSKSKALTLSLFLLSITVACQNGNQATTDSKFSPTEVPTLFPTAAAVTLSDAETMDEPSNLADFDGGVYTLDIVPEETEARYVVEEEFFGRGFGTAIGITKIVEGEFTILLDGTPSVQAGEFRVDLRTLTSDENRRDNAIRRRWLESNTFPIAVFVPIAVSDFPAGVSYTEGVTVQFKLSGDLTVHETTNAVTFDVTASGVGDTLVGVATTNFLMTDFGFNPPEIFNILQAENEVRVELDFTLRNRSS
jgi:polyisoprenoid-binding protein YceI